MGSFYPDPDLLQFTTEDGYEDDLAQITSEDEQDHEVSQTSTTAAVAPAQSGQGETSRLAATRKSRSRFWPEKSDPHVRLGKLAEHRAYLDQHVPFTLVEKGSNSGRNMLAVFEDTDSTPRLRFNTRIVIGRSPALWPNFRSVKDHDVPAGTTLAEMCQFFPLHCWGDGLRIFIAENWTAEQIWREIPEAARNKHALIRPWNYLQQAMGREVDEMSVEAGNPKRVPIKREKTKAAKKTNKKSKKAGVAGVPEHSSDQSEILDGSQEPEEVDTMHPTYASPGVNHDGRQIADNNSGNFGASVRYPHGSFQGYSIGPLQVPQEPMHTPGVVYAPHPLDDVADSPTVPSGQQHSTSVPRSYSYPQHINSAENVNGMNMQPHPMSNLSQAMHGNNMHQMFKPSVPSNTHDTLCFPSFQTSQPWRSDQSMYGGNWQPQTAQEHTMAGMTYGASTWTMPPSMSTHVSNSEFDGMSALDPYAATAFTDGIGAPTVSTPMPAFSQQQRGLSNPQEQLTQVPIRRTQVSSRARETQSRTPRSAIRKRKSADTVTSMSSSDKKKKNKSELDKSEGSQVAVRTEAERTMDSTMNENDLALYRSQMSAKWPGAENWSREEIQSHMPVFSGVPTKVWDNSHVAKQDVKHEQAKWRRVTRKDSNDKP